MKFLFPIILVMFTFNVYSADDNFLFHCRTDNKTEIKAYKKSDKLVVEFGGQKLESIETIGKIKSRYESDYNKAIKEGADDFEMFNFTTDNYFVSIGSGIDKPDYSDANNRLTVTSKTTGHSDTYWCGNDDSNNLESMK
ncbi:hypothetical protein L6R44_23580 [Enterobacter cloacae complex sp. ECC445]|uniref:hypothetical protein n=1 Tax=Enterobacter cloacae complex sp. ECC445 TaxID=2913213 RepID=UPI001F3ADAEF|nr:hypothetical protein [Enterobacter cloacae complex sp. ECC445]MCG0459053.1 hypothetical protein [Enterobacter cloacae complex sp. ECC445]